MKIDKKYIYDEIRSIIASALSFFIVDGVLVLTDVYNGDWTQEKLLLLLAIFGRSIVKALLSQLFPSLFPRRSS